MVMKMSSMLFCLVGVVIICSVWVVRSMSKKRLLMSTGYECPFMVQSDQWMSGRLRSPPTQSTEFLCLGVRSSMVLHMSSIYCRSLFGGRYIAAIVMCLLLLRCILVAVIYNCVGVTIGSWMMSDLMASSTPPPPHTHLVCLFVEVSSLVEKIRCQL